MATLKVSVTTMSTINDETKSNRSVISSSTSSTVNISAEGSDLQDISTIHRTSTQTTTTTATATTTSADDGSTSAGAEDEKEQTAPTSAPAAGKETTTAVLKLSQESSQRFRAAKTKVYRIKNLNWYCQKCDIYCNSAPQYEVHMMSQKHKLAATSAPLLTSSSLAEFNLALAKLPAQDGSGGAVYVEPKASSDTCVVRRVKTNSLSESENDQEDYTSKKKLNPISKALLLKYSSTRRKIDSATVPNRIRSERFRVRNRTVPYRLVPQL